MEECKSIELLYIEKLKKILRDLEIEPQILAYKYFITIIPIAINYITKNEKFYIGDLYLKIAERHKTTYLKAEKAIRYCYKNDNIDKNEMMQKYFGVTYKIKNSNLVILIAERIIENLTN